MYCRLIQLLAVCFNELNSYPGVLRSGHSAVLFSAHKAPSQCVTHLDDIYVPLFLNATNVHRLHR